VVEVVKNITLSNTIFFVVGWWKKTIICRYNEATDAALKWMNAVGR